MRHASLFSGIGGFDLAAEWMGWENVMQCEIDPFCQRVLRHHFPSAHLYGDIREIDGTAWRGKIDVLTGGFPCQPFSTAGQQRGTEDDRHLWPEMLRVIREIQPTWIVAENVRGIITNGDGVVFEGVRSNLEEHGYECQPILIPACAVGAPHRRDRVWFIAHSPSIGTRRRSCEVRGEDGGPDDERLPDAVEPDQGTDPNRQGIEQERRFTIGSGGGESKTSAGNGNCDAANTRCANGEPGGSKGVERKEAKWCNSTKETQRCPRNDWGKGWLQAATRLCRMDDGLPGELYMFGGMGYPDSHERNGKSKGEKKKPTLEESVWREMQSVWSDWKAAPPSYRDGGEEFCHSLCPLPRQRTQEDWFRDVGFTEEDKTVLRLWNRICAESFQEAQHLFPELLERIGAIECKKKVGCSGLTVPKWRRESLKAFGNAIVPAVALQIFNAIELAEHS